jgi:hypothetical protein
VPEEAGREGCGWQAGHRTLSARRRRADEQQACQHASCGWRALGKIARKRTSLQEK